MTDNYRKILVPQYLQKFNCIGPACEDNCCCGGWNVQVDEPTYRLYKNLRNKEISQKLDQVIARNRTNPTDANYAMLKFNEKGCCELLTENGYCSLQLALGPKYLSMVCKSYPRFTSTVHEEMERSLTMSCPEAARIALLNPEPMEFEYIQEKQNERTLVMNKIEMLKDLSDNDPKKYFWEIRNFTVGLLQNREYDLSERLIILGLLLNKVEQAVYLEGNMGIKSLLDRYYTLISNSGSLKEELWRIPGQKLMKIKLAKEINDQKLTTQLINKRYAQCYSEMSDGLGCKADISLDEMLEKHSAAYQHYLLPFISENSHILENYLVNTVFKELFPFSRGLSIFENYVLLVMRYALIMLNLTGMASWHKKMDVDLAIRLIQSFSHEFDHNTAFLKLILEMLKTNNMVDMSYMAILLKN